MIFVMVFLVEEQIQKLESSERVVILGENGRRVEFLNID